MRRFVVAMAALLLVTVHGGGAFAQGRDHARSPAPAAITGIQLPSSVTTEQTVVLPGRTLHFTATAASVPVLGTDGRIEAEIATIAYRLDGADPRTRPVAFVVNGGPGFASAWLQLGGIGPWRLPMEGVAAAPSATPAVEPNADTWLDFTDLVFIDPAGTGYGRIDAAKDMQRRLWSVSGDIESLAQAIGTWLDGNGRELSPKVIVGESYGGLRAPLLARALTERHGAGIAALVLISPALDMDRGSAAFDPLFWAQSLPSEVAIARAAHGPITRAGLADAEAYASGDYLLDLVRGLADPAAVARVSAHVAALTGLDPAFVRRHSGRIGPGTFLRAIDRPQGRVASRFDGTVTMPDPSGGVGAPSLPDPQLAALQAPLSAAMTALYADRLHWHPSGPYRLLNVEANRAWDWGRGAQPQAMTALRRALALDPRLRVLVAAGLFDLVVPYFRTQMLLDTIPPAAGGDRVRFVMMPSGHMIYIHDAARAALREAAEHMIEGQ